MRLLWILALTAACGFAGDSSVTAPPTALERGYGEMYNLQFDQAHKFFQEWTAQSPADPLGPVSDAAAYLFSELDRLRILQSEFFMHDDAFMNRQKPSADLKIKQEFEAALAHSEELAAKTLQADPSNQNAEFATLMRLGLRSDYLALIEKRYLASLSDVKTGRAIAEKLIAQNPGYSDAYLAIGVENYLLSLKPAPLRWLLRVGGAQTDRDRGLENLRLTAESGHYLLPYARVLLAVAALRDRNVPRAKELLEGLAKQFPNNPLYGQELARLH